jgi:succinate dehydrogenase (ubiquinone) cytochrome b560 subunit
VTKHSRTRGRPLIPIVREPLGISYPDQTEQSQLRNHNVLSEGCPAVAATAYVTPQCLPCPNLRSNLSPNSCRPATARYAVVHDGRFPCRRCPRQEYSDEVSYPALRQRVSIVSPTLESSAPHEILRHPQSPEEHTNHTLVYRQVTSTPKTEDPSQILVKQRLNRPIAPHLTIYKPQIGWIGSSLHRITGVALSGTLYIWATAYLASPALGWHLESASMVAAMGALPLAAKVLLKTTLALPFTYHAMNGIRHLMWDLGRGLTNPVIIKTGWTVVGLSIASAVGLALI